MSSDDLDELDKVLNDMITASQEGKPAGNHYNAYATAGKYIMVAVNVARVNYIYNNMLFFCLITIFRPTRFAIFG
jgi:hypothetical protein